jgi:tripartite-type tricarboxylate transporter receptor subunit TctC
MFRKAEWRSFALAFGHPRAHPADDTRLKHKAATMITRRTSLTLLLSAATGLMTSQPRPAIADEFPSRMMHIVVPGASGTPPDIISRMIANELAQAEGWTVIVENKPGAMQTVGATDVLKLPADGYTILAASLPAALAPSLLQSVNVRLDKDFTPVIKLATAYHVLVVNPSVPVTTLPELVALLRKQPDKLNFSSGGFGTPAHVTGELFKLQTGIRATHVPYQALPQAIGDLLNGTNQFQFITPLPVLDLIAAGKLRALAVAAPVRSGVLKDVPTVGEAGFPDLISQDWIGLLVRRGTPDDVVQRLNEAANRVLMKPELRSAIARLGAEAVGGSSSEFSDFLASQMVYWAKVVRDSGMKMHPL